MNFNKEQEEAIISKMPLTIIAGPGSGKTATIIKKITRMVNNINELNNFMILTFTNGAANNIINKLEVKFSELEGKEVNIDKNNMYIGTFHSIFYKLLKEYNSELTEEFNIPKNIKIIEPNDDMKIFKLSIKKYYNNDGKLKQKQLDENFKNIHEVTITDIYNSLKNIGNKKPKDLNYLIERTLMESYSEDENEIKLLEKVLIDFINHKIEEGLFSFNDILLFTYLLLKDNENVRNKISNKFNYLFIDEYQDTNPTQDAIVKFIYNKNDCEVGDGYQSIYKFLGAEIDNILNLIKEKDRNVIQLTKNYHSTENIVQFTNDLTTLFSKKIPNFIPCTSEAIGLENKKIILKEYSNQEDDIIDHIKESLLNGVNPSEIAIITRNNFEYEIEKKLSMYDVPYKKIGGKGFYQKSEITILINLIKILNKDYTFMDFESISSFMPGLGEKSIQKISADYFDRDNKEDTIKNIISNNKKSNDKLLKFSEIIFLNDQISYKSIIDIIDNHELNIRKQLIENGNTISKQNEIMKSIEFFLDEIKDILFNGEQDILEEFLYTISLNSKKNNEEEIEKITLTTAHSSKGLEWRNCYILNASDGKFPGIRSLEYDSQLEEEKRLFYVAISRAKEFLMITSSKELNQFIQPFIENEYFEKEVKEKENNFWF